ncbi:YbaB/EbfC DNA-binding family protein [Saccharothrix saharensis]|uniref:YbaB/EbfC DNA-binding family protein n=1 Tax=Saccharothrix saharensis TaxID=571190 RepID=A0A543JJA5_9PSEU|nr:YbaB/EbfC family nucleoid-associated protein [Saccharothrix saharensis]TQM82854.1 YbaB/EbfC DNA-binding family protein [Saccharothrix saharensis]
MDATNPQRMIADLEARARELAERSRELRDRIGRAQATQRSADGVVTATVAPNGSLRHIEFSPAAGECTPARLGEVVLETVRRAQEQAARQVAAAVGGTAALEFLTGSETVPAPDEPPLPRSLRAPDDEPGTTPS